MRSPQKSQVLLMAAAVATVGVAYWASRGRQEPVVVLPERLEGLEVYPPNSPALVGLLASAARLAGLPESWAASPDLHQIITNESRGWVGRPNYTYGKRRDGRFPSDIHSPSMRSMWPQVWAELRAGTLGAKSTATGLGMLTLSNVNAYYPAGAEGIGDPLSEAVGFLRYVSARYGTPEEAGRFKRDKGWY